MSGSITSPLLFLPKKITSSIDYGPHLRSIISRVYSDSSSNYADQINLLNKSRQDSLSQSTGSDSTGRDLLYKYFSQLEQLELRFPDLKLPFPWEDAFTSKSISQLSLAYEKASVIYNIGATLSCLAANSARSSPEGLKRAFHSFRCAAGMYTYINENFLHAPSTDLSREVVKILVVLMEAQATEVFIETMGEKLGKSAGLKARVCMQASMLYAGVIEEIKEFVVKEVFIREWTSLVQVKAKYFASLAQFNRAVADAASSKYGDSLTRFVLAESLAKEASKLAATFSKEFTPLTASASFLPDAPVSLVDLTKNHLTICSETRAKAQRDNDLIYNAVLPSEAALPVIEKSSVAAPISIQDVYASPEVQKIIGPDLFTKLIPLAVHESASLYSEEKAKLVRAEAERVDLAEGERIALLEYLGLPASLERFSSAGSNGQDNLADPGGVVRNWSDELRRYEASGRVEEMLRSIKSLKDGVTKELDAAGRELEMESRECESMRSKFGHLWEQAPSSSLTRKFRQDMKSHKDSLDQASQSDGQVEALWQGIKNDLVILMDNNRVEQAFTVAVGSSVEGGSQNLLDDDFNEDDKQDEDMSKRVGVIKEALSRLNKIKKERTDVFKDLKEKIQGDDISHILILNRKGSTDVEPLFATALEKFRPHQARISATLQHQRRALEEISAEFKILSEGKRAKEIQLRWKGAEARKKDLINRLGGAKEGYEEVREGVRKGVQFYQDLTSLVAALKNDVIQFLNSRNGERNRMKSMAEVKLRLEGGNNGNGGAASIERGFNSLDLGSRSPSSPYASSAPPPPTQSSYQQHAYQSMPTTGAFSTSAPSPPPPPPSNPYASSPYQSAPSPATHQSYPAYSPSPPPSQPNRSNSNSYLPAPPAPISYSSYGGGSASSPSASKSPNPYQQQAPPQQQYPQQYQNYGQPPPPQSPYGAPPPPPQSQSQQQQHQQQKSPYGAYNPYQQQPPPR